ncbi:hypothetical protein FSARC_12614 [Fusarium sarcochroum]|uniref:Transcription factor domain-containing protein n=1 Tax=Fusarium sarcochroum TaxID=1208366 RepID=A0A8H4WW41_9HYPO|nr:hypothetical protein FSARC_12614 [Fusarium sarcochroum]
MPRIRRTVKAAKTDGRIYNACFIDFGNMAPSDSQAQFYDDQYDLLSGHISQFFYPPGLIVEPLDMGMIFAFTPEKVKRFLYQIGHPHIPIPFIHHADLDINEAYNSLLVTICCTGACKSDSLTGRDVQEMLDSLAVAVQRDCTNAPPDVHEGGQSVDTRPNDVGKLQATLLTYALLLQFGGREQEKHIRQLRPILVAYAQRTGLVDLSDDFACLPSLHQVKIERNTLDVRLWSWESWIDQERKCRLVHSLILLDTLIKVKLACDP